MLGFAGHFFLQEDDEQTRGFLFELKMRGLCPQIQKSPRRAGAS